MSKKREVSMKDLAEELGVSVSTISRALKNHPDISPQVAKRVQALAEMRNYTPNPLAMGLRRHETKTIGVIVPDIVTYFYAAIISGIEIEASKNGYYVVISSSYEHYAKEVESINHLLNIRVEGLIVCLSQETTDYSHFDIIKEKEIPLVFFDRVCRTNEFASVTVDNKKAAKALTIHLHKGGARHIAHIAGPLNLNISRERIEGYKEGLAECGLPFRDDLLLSSNLSFDCATAATQKLLNLNKKPNAIFGVNDTIAFAAMKTIKDYGLKIPADISLVGFTDEFHATVVDPTLTSIMHPTLQIGRQAASLLIEQIHNKIAVAPKQVVLNTKLIVRGSSVKPMTSGF